MIFYIIGLAILICGCIRFKQGFMLYLAYKLILTTNISIISEPGLPLLTLEMFMTLAYIALFFFNKNKCSKPALNFPYMGIFIALAACWTISSIFAIAGFGAELSNLVKILSENIIFIWMMWYIVETEEDFALIYKYITVLVLITCLYGVYEYIIQDNPLNAYELTLIKDQTKAVTSGYSVNDRGYRTYSFFAHCIGAGMNWALYTIITVWLWARGKLKGIKPYTILCLGTAALAIVGVFLTKQRGPILFLFVGCLSAVNFKKKRTYVLAVLAVIAVTVLVPLLADKLTVLLSFFDSDSASTISGSNMSQRIGQFKVAFNLLDYSPITGIGNKYENVLPKAEYRGLLGLESIWLMVIVMYGLLGLVIYVCYVIYSTFIVSHKFKAPSVFWLMAAYWATYTVSSLPGFKDHLFYLVLIYFIKESPRYKAALENKAKLLPPGMASTSHQKEI